MAEDKQKLSPTEWKSVTDYVVELSQRMNQAVSAPSDSPKGDDRVCEAKKTSD